MQSPLISSFTFSSQKTVLFAWELGGGPGHMMPMLPLAEDLARAGHRVYVAMRNLGGAAAVFGRAGVHFLPAAFRTEGQAPFPRGATYAHLLANVGWYSDTGLSGLACAWRNLMRLVKPDLLVLDHSPTALLAASGLEVKKVVMGLGFFCPPDVSPFPPLRAGADPDRCAADEARVLESANRVLGRWKQPPLERLGQLFAEVDETILATFPEMDHYGERPGARYWGHVSGSGGVAPQWAEGGGKRIYAYLKRSAAIEEILEELAKRRQPTLVYAMGIEPSLRRRFESASMRFETRPLDMKLAARECDLAVLNANHGTLCDVLLAGKPAVMLPLHLEQRVLAQRVSELGVGPWITPRQGRGQEIGRMLDGVLSDGRYAAAAEGFAARHGGFDAGRQKSELLRRVLGLLEGEAGAAPVEEGVACEVGVDQLHLRHSIAQTAAMVSTSLATWKTRMPG